MFGSVGCNTGLRNPVLLLRPVGEHLEQVNYYEGSMKMESSRKQRGYWEKEARCHACVRLLVCACSSYFLHL